MTTEIRFTDAPEDYDGFGTRTLEPRAALNRAGGSIRKVEIDPQHLRWQSQRYGSGLHVCLTQAELDEWLAFGFAKRVERPWTPGIGPSDPPDHSWKAD